MIYSMTAFARIEQAGPHGTLSWELRSVNHRYLEPLLRLPDTFRDLETPLREMLRQTLSRGKIECTLRYAEDTIGAFQIDHERARQLIEAAQSVSDLIRQPAPMDPLTILSWPGVVVADAIDTQSLSAEAVSLFKQALEQLKEGRSREGHELKRLLEERLDGMKSEIAVLTTLIPDMIAHQQQKILARFNELNLELDPHRLEQEMVFLAQKSDVAEELDRLQTHIDEVHRVLQGGGVVGRRLDFLMQELNREANTLGSKAIDSRSTQTAVNLKVLIEQMREQVQNIE